MRVVKDYKPQYVLVGQKERSNDIKAYKRRSRRAFRQYLRTGSVKDFNRAEKPFVNEWD
jgi:hypothetical protein